MIREQDIFVEELLENLPLLRKRLNLTQQDLADLLGLTRQTIYNIESKKGNISKATILAILFIFSTNPLTSMLLPPLRIVNDKLLKQVCQGID